MTILLLYVAAAINIVLGALVLARDVRKQYAWFFAITLFAVAGWALGDAGLLVLKTDPALGISKSVFYAIPMVIPVALTLFAMSYPNKKLRRTVIVGILAPTLLATVYVGLHPDRLLSAFDTTTNLNIASPQTGPFTVYAAYFSITFLVTYIVLFLAMRREENMLEKTQLKYTFVGVLLSSIPALVTNLTLPLNDIKSLIWAGPLFTSIFVSITALSIIRHKMFDIRLVVARALGYGLSVAILATLYGFIVFGLANIILGISFSPGVQIALSLATAVTGLTFHRLQRKFDTLTSAFFFRDAYEPQALFDDLNKVLVSSLDMNYLMRHSSEVISRYLKPEYTIIGLRDGPKNYRIFGTKKVHITKSDVNALREATPRIHSSVLVADYLEHRHAEIKGIMKRNDIAVLVRLSQNVHRTQEGLGYIALGHKKSGSPYSQQDIKTLQSVANELVIAILNALHYEEIQNFNVTLQAQIDDATRKLRRTNDKLKALDVAKDDFVSMASHQLRTPLTSIKGYTSMVLEGDAGKINATQRQLLEQSFASSQRMVYLIADLLNVSRLKTGKFVIEARPVNIAELVQQEIGQLTQTAAGRSLTLTYEMPKNFPILQLDETKTRQVIMNFIDNAIYYTPAGGHIQVKLHETPDAVEFRVVDDGIGVPKVEQPHLFTKFYRAGNARTARPDGTGLGLFMAKKIIIAQGGAIIFDTQEGKGSTFGFTLAKKTAV